MGLAILWICGCVSSTSCEELDLFVAAGLRQPTDRLVDTFCERTGHKVFVDYGGSGKLLAQIVTSGRGDLYMPAEFFYVEQLRVQNRVHSYRLIVAHIPVVGVNRQKTHMVRFFEDLARPGVRLALGDPKAMAFGRIASNVLTRSGLGVPILENVVTYGATVKQLALYVASGDVDASIIGRADAFQYPDSIEILPIPKSYYEPITVAVAVLKPAHKSKAAFQLRDFLASEQSVEVFQRFGFFELTEKRK